MKLRIRPLLALAATLAPAVMGGGDRFMADTQNQTHPGFNAALEAHLVRPLMQTLLTPAPPPDPPSPVIKALKFAPADTIVRRAAGSDCWPLTWGDD